MKTLRILLALAACVTFAAAGAPAQDINSDANLPPSVNLGGGNSGPGIDGIPTWHSLAQPTYNRSRPGGNWVGNKFYLIGGELLSSQWGFNRADTVEIFSTNNTWALSGSLMPMPCSNIFGSTAALGDDIYVFGGYDSAGTYLNAVQVYNTTSDTWTISTHVIPKAILGCLAETVGNQIYVIGGADSLGAISDVWTFTPTGGFVAGPPMLAPRRYLTGALASNGKIYVVGGYGAGTVFESLDTNTGTWAAEPAIPVDRAACGVVSVGKYVLLYGGNWSSRRDDCDLFNINKGTWEAAKAAALGTMANTTRTFAHGLYTGPGGPAAFGSCGYNGSFLYDTNALYD